MIELGVEQGDLVEARSDVVVRTVRSDGAALTPVARRLELAAGADVVRHLEGLGPIAVGSAVLTPGGRLAAPYLLHLALRSVDEPVTEASVRRALAAGLERVGDWGLERVAMPPVGTGAGALDVEVAARLLREAVETRGSDGGRPSHVTVVVETEYEHDVYTRMLHGP